MKETLREVAVAVDKLTFTLSGLELERYLKWEKTLPPEPPTAIGGGMTYSFTPTSVGTVVVIESWDGQKINVTDFDNW